MRKFKHVALEMTSEYDLQGQEKNKSVNPFLQAQNC